MKNKLIAGSLACLMIGGVSAITGIPVQNRVVAPAKAANSVNAQKVVTAILNTINDNPCDFYATGNDLAEFQEAIQLFMTLFNPTEEAANEMIELIKQIGSTITANKTDYVNCCFEVENLSEQFFANYGLETSIDSQAHTFTIKASLGSSITSKTLKCFAPLPILLDYTAPETPAIDLPTGYQNLVPYGAPVKLADTVNWTECAQALNNHGINLASLYGSMGLNSAPESKDGYLVYGVSGLNPGHKVGVVFNGVETPDVTVLNSKFENVDVGAAFNTDSYLYFKKFQTGTGYWALSYKGEYQSDWTAETAKAAFGDIVVQAYISPEWNYENLLLDGQSKDIYVNIDNHLTQEDVISQVTAKDVFGVDCNVIVESSDYVTDQRGDFNIVLKATDSYGVTAHATLRIHVLDLTKPIITQKSQVVIPYGGKITEAELLKYFTVEDNVSVASKIFTLPSGFKFDSALKFGNYDLSLTVTDTSGNKTTTSFTVEVCDKVAPVISKKEGNTDDPIVIGYSKTLKYDIKTILNLFKAVDEIDGECEVYLKSGKLNMDLGSQTLVLGSKDTHDNEGLRSITVTIQSDVPPVFIISDRLVATSPEAPLDLSDLTRIVQNVMLRNVEVSSLSINAKEYIKNSSKPGTYTVDYSYVDENNVTNNSSFDVKVTNDIPTEQTEKKESGWTKFWRSIREFFEKLFNWFKGKGFKTNADLNVAKPSVPSSTTTSVSTPDSSNIPASSKSKE